MIIFDITKLQRLSKVHDLAIQIKVLQNTDEEASLGSDWADWTDVGIGKYIKTESDERENTPVTEVSEHESSPETGVVDFSHPPGVSNPTLTFTCYHNDSDFHTDNERE